jgi:hypothetical protein
MGGALVPGEIGLPKQNKKPKDAPMALPTPTPRLPTLLSSLLFGRFIVVPSSGPKSFLRYSKGPVKEGQFDQGGMHGFVIETALSRQRLYCRRRSGHGSRSRAYRAQCRSRAGTGGCFRGVDLIGGLLVLNKKKFLK